MLVGVPGLACPAVLLRRDGCWTAAVAVVAAGGRASMFAAFQAGPSSLHAPSCWMLAFEGFSEPGAALEFLRLVQMAGRAMPGLPSGAIQPIGPWSSPRGAHPVAPPCPDARRRDPGGMSRLAVRLAFVLDSAASGPLPARDVDDAAARAVIRPDAAVPGYYDRLFPNLPSWVSVEAGPEAPARARRPDGPPSRMPGGTPPSTSSIRERGFRPDLVGSMGPFPRVGVSLHAEEIGVLDSVDVPPPSPPSQALPSSQAPSPISMRAYTLLVMVDPSSDPGMSGLAAFFSADPRA